MPPAKLGRQTAMIRVEVHDERLKASLTQYAEYLRGTRSVMIIIGRGIRDYTKDTIRMGGRPTWPALSTMSIQRTGRTKPLHGFDRYIHYTASAAQAVVFASSPSDKWTLQQHHDGYISPAVYNATRVMRVPQRSGSPLFFKSRKESIVPARPFWPTVAEVTLASATAVDGWIKEGARQKWH